MRVARVIRSHRLSARAVVAMLRLLVAVLAVCAVCLPPVSCGAAADSSVPPHIGFFSPTYVDQYIYHVDFSMLNAYLYGDPESGKLVINLPQLRASLDAVRGLRHTVNIDLGPVICDVQAAARLRKTYATEDGIKRTKVFDPLFPNKIRVIVGDDEIERRLKGFVRLVKEYRDHIGVLFIADEPYINGISKAELERAIRTIRGLFRKEGVTDVSLGVIFAGAMFNADFAAQIQKSMARYVAQIDDNYKAKQHLLNARSKEGDDFRSWVEAMRKSRLTTYDTCGNMFTAGGLPKGLDVVSFDFYLSTLLLDNIHENTLDYFARTGGHASCSTFRGKTMSALRKDLSFFSDRSWKDFLDAGAQERDRKLLDGAFDCRMRSAVDLLKKEAAKAGYKNLKIMLIGESSANGVMDFRADGSPKKKQQQERIEQRMLDEVKRSLAYYTDNRGSFTGGLMFFLYPDAYDNSINLFVSGAKGAKKVSEHIYARRNLEGVSSEKRGPRVVSLGEALLDYIYRFAEKDAKAVLGDWSSKTPVVVLTPSAEHVRLSVRSSDPALVSAELTADNRLKMQYHPGRFGEAVISVTARSEKGLEDSKTFRVIVDEDD